MNNRNEDYPEKLNPFRKRSSIRRSIRRIANSFSKSFGKNIKEKVEVRTTVPSDPPNNLDFKYNFQRCEKVPYRHTVATVDKLETTREPEILLPRSRFNERLAKGSSLVPTLRMQTWAASGKETNPFENDEEQQCYQNEHDDQKLHRTTSATATSTGRRRRRKKRAPLPPGFSERNDFFLNIPRAYGSQLSVTSYETDVSSSYCSDSDFDVETQTENVSVMKDIANISTEIQNYTTQAVQQEEQVIEQFDDKDTKDTHSKEDVNQNVLIGKSNSESLTQNIPVEVCKVEIFHQGECDIFSKQCVKEKTVNSNILIDNIAVIEETNEKIVNLTTENTVDNSKIHQPSETDTKEKHEMSNKCEYDAYEILKLNNNNNLESEQPKQIEIADSTYNVKKLIQTLENTSITLNNSKNCAVTEEMLCNSDISSQGKSDELQLVSDDIPVPKPRVRKLNM